MTNWQPIETAPKDGSKIDLWVRAFSIGAGGKITVKDVGRYPASYWGEQVETYTNPFELRVGDEGWVHKDGLHWLLVETCGYRVTHWLPLPDSPA